MKHCSTPQQRIEWTIQLLASPACHGMVSQLSRDHHVSRQSLYRWKQKAEQALQDLFMPRPQPEHPGGDLQREVLTLLIETHASYRQIQTCLQKLMGISLSLGTICRLVHNAGERARAWLAGQEATSVRALALDEQFSSKRGQAYLNVVDVHSGQVWASLPPAAVEGESWMIVLWDLQTQGVRFDTLVSDGGCHNEFCVETPSLSKQTERQRPHTPFNGFDQREKDLHASKDCFQKEDENRKKEPAVCKMLHRTKGKKELLPSQPGKLVSCFVRSVANLDYDTAIL